MFTEVARVEILPAAMPNWRSKQEGICVQRQKGPMQRNSLASPSRSLEAADCKEIFESGALFNDESSLANRFKTKDWSLDTSFQTLLSEADLELAKLLREIGTPSDGPVGGASQRKPVNEPLARAVECAVKQFLLRAQLSNLAFTDELTGLYNRRGFMAFTERQFRLGRRSGREMLLFFIDVDGLKRINDSFGHSEGDKVLAHTAEVLRKTFRDSDVLARLGGDEFAALAIEASGHSEATITARLQQNVETISGLEPRYPLSLSLGVVRFDPRTAGSMTELMLRADKAMYEHKTRLRRLT